MLDVADGLVLASFLMVSVWLLVFEKVSAVETCSPYYVIATFHAAYSFVFYFAGEAASGILLATVSFLVMLYEAEEFYTGKPRRWK